MCAMSVCLHFTVTPRTEEDTKMKAGTGAY